MLFAIFTVLALIVAFYFKEIEQKWDYIFFGFALVFAFLEYSTIANADVYNHLFYTKQIDCNYTYNNVSLQNASSCQEYYILNYNRTVNDFNTNNYIYTKLFDNYLFEQSGLIFWGAVILFVLYIGAKGLKILNYL